MTVSEDHRFKPFNFKPFETDRWFRFRVHYVEVLSEAKYRKHRRAVLVVFVVLELGRKAEFRLDFSAGWTPVSRDKRVLKALGISLPLPLEVDWKRLLEGRLMEGRFGPPSEPGARNKLQDARPYSACAGQSLIGHCCFAGYHLDRKRASSSARSSCPDCFSRTKNRRAQGQKTIATASSKTCWRWEQIQGYRSADWHKGAVFSATTIRNETSAKRIPSGADLGQRIRRRR